MRNGIDQSLFLYIDGSRVADPAKTVSADRVKTARIFQPSIGSGGWRGRHGHGAVDELLVEAAGAAAALRMTPRTRQGVFVHRS
jgi:hypothetical protein